MIMKKFVFLLIGCIFTVTGLLAQNNVVNQVYIKGYFNQEWPIEMAIQTDGNYIAAGQVYYPGAIEVPILVAGWWEDYPSDDGSTFHNIRLYELQEDGIMSGSFIIHLKKLANGHFQFSDAQRTYLSMEEGDEEGPIFNATCSTVMPEWFEPTLIPATPHEIGESYEYRVHGDNGGYFEMSFNDDGSFIFDVSDNPAGDSFTEAANDADRPGRLVGNVMEYPRVNYCNDTLRATFYRYFVVVETQQVPGPDHSCNAINAVMLKKSHDEDEEGY